MSLIIGFNVRDGIVIAADRCSTTDNDNGTTHNFDSRKIVLLDKRLAIAHCGDYIIGNDVSVHEFLESCVNMVDSNTDVMSIPLSILSKYNEAGYKSDNTFLVCGFDKENNGFIYEIIPSKNSVVQQNGNRLFGSVWCGMSEIAAPIIKGSTYDRMSLLDAAALCKLAITTTGYSQMYRGVKITVGPFADVYVMHKSGNVKWYSGDAGFLKEKESEDK